MKNCWFEHNVNVWHWDERTAGSWLYVLTFNLNCNSIAAPLKINRCSLVTTDYKQHTGQENPGCQHLILNLVKRFGFAWMYFFYWIFSLTSTSSTIFFTTFILYFLLSHQLEVEQKMLDPVNVQRPECAAAPLLVMNSNQPPRMKTVTC